MIGIVFIIGLSTGMFAGSVLFYIFYYDEIKAVREFNKRQERYKRMV